MAVLIAVLIVIVGGVVAWQYWPEGPEGQEPAEQNPLIVEEPPVADETANWQTYRNEEWGFEMKHPKGWPIKAENNSITLRNKIGDFYSYCGASVTPTEGVMKMAIEVLNKELSVDEKIKECDDNASSCLPKAVTLGGQKAVELFDVGGIPDYYKRVYTVKGDKFYMFYLTVSCDMNLPEKLSEVEKIFNQILSTFKFID